MLIDFHVHTIYSKDSLTRLEDIVRKSRESGIIPAITDHNTTRANERMRKITKDFIPGEEILTKQGDLIGLYIEEEVPKGIDGEEAIDRIKEQGGIAYLPHMFDKTRKGAPGLGKRVDVIEVLNGRAFENYNRMAYEFAEKNNKLKAAGSDAHFLFEFGSVYTEVEEFDLQNPKELLKALRKAKVYGKGNPFFRPATSFVKALKKIINPRLP
jgi:predicted metal-dependent phosphoesterase TrpH